ncbi:exo-alpha-sialidase [Dechloromonas denitrificans]|uniref:exo-alpha-sialidase n=1 Tax=Dechloromonas denitrificans TaxID=281362 RepID=UPI001CF7F3A7|nr:exo-alpha-sialidase [Dechloromonas denitrificans]UCV11570.1 exo-alpha-sialidase [Dechloromonas denitrificans]
MITKRLTLLALGLWLIASTAVAADTMPGMAKAPRLELGSSAIFAPDGTLLVAAKQGEHIMLYRSQDQGQSWSAPAAVNALPEAISADGENRPKLAFSADGGLLVSWTRPLGKPYSGAIRLARADDGRNFSPPLTVHKDPAEITHRFESLLTTPDNKVILAWIDKRDLEAAKTSKAAYRGAAIYSAVSNDGGRSFQPERKLADHSCECCRIASALDRDGTPLFMWRHVFAPNERDHALLRFTAEGASQRVQRATFDRWKVDGCPHHGPSLTVDAAGLRHAVWFNQKDGAGRVFYGRLLPGDEIRVEGQRVIGGLRAAHADLAAAGGKLLIAWKEFDGERTQLRGLVSTDGGEKFSELALASTDGASDQVRVIRQQEKLYVFWRTEKEGFRLFPLP